MLKDPGDGAIFRIVSEVKATGEAPAISFDCGTEDDLIDENRADMRGNTGTSM